MNIIKDLMVTGYEVINKMDTLDKLLSFIISTYVMIVILLFVMIFHYVFI